MYNSPPSITTRAKITLAIFYAAILLTCVYAAYAAFIKPRAAAAQIPQQPVVQQLLLPAGQKLKTVNWHCAAVGICEPWTLTKPRKSDERPENYVYQNADGSRKYIIKEQ